MSPWIQFLTKTSFDKRAGQAGEIPLEGGELSPSRMKIFPCKHSKWAGPIAEVEPIFIIFYVS